MANRVVPGVRRALASLLATRYSLLANIILEEKSSRRAFLLWRLFWKNREEKIVSGCPDDVERGSPCFLSAGSRSYLRLVLAWGFRASWRGLPSLALPDRASSDTISEKLVLRSGCEGYRRILHYADRIENTSMDWCLQEPARGYR